MHGPHSLVLVTVDCLRADHVGFMGYGGSTTPFMDALAADSIVMNNAIVAGAPTYDSFPAIMASRYPLALGRDVVGLAPGEPTVASILNQCGYSTAGFIAGNPYLSKGFGYASGFDVFNDFLADSEKDQGEGATQKANGWSHRTNGRIQKMSGKFGLRWLYDEFYFRYGQLIAARTPTSLDQLRRFPSAEVIVGEAANWLKQRQEGPFFLWLHLMDPHGPYYPQREALELCGHKEISAGRARYLNTFWTRSGIGPARARRYCDELISLYDSGIRWVDQQLGRLVQVLRSLGLWDDCVLALTADHGEEFLDHGGRMHAPPKVSEEVVHVPLLMYLPRTAPRRVESTFSLLHLAPTLLDYLQIPVPVEFRGQSYWPNLRAGQGWDGDAIVECISGCSNPLRRKDRQGRRLMAIRGSRHKLVVDFDAGSDQLFDLQADPRELRPLPWKESSMVRRRLLERARSHIRESLSSRDSGTRAALVLRDIRRETVQVEAE